MIDFFGIRSKNNSAECPGLFQDQAADDNTALIRQSNRINSYKIILEIWEIWGHPWGHPWGYPWSSTCFQCGMLDYDPLVKDRTLLGLITDWREFLRSGEEGDLHLLRQTTRTGRPAGDDEFVEKVERITGRELKIKRAGRPARLE
jgi:hypothetical protein